MLALLFAPLTGRLPESGCRARPLKGVEDGSAIRRSRGDRGMLGLALWDLKDESLLGLVEYPRKDETE